MVIGGTSGTSLGGTPHSRIPNASYVASRGNGAMLPVPTYRTQVIRQESPATAPAPRASTQRAPSAVPMQALDTTRSTSMGSPVGSFFTPTTITKAKRQAVNDPGYYGGQAANVNATLSRMLDPSYLDVSTMDRDINPMYQSIQRNAEQSARNLQAQAAERAAAEGTLGAGGFGATTQQIEEQARGRAGDAIAELLLNKSNVRQQGMERALGIGAELTDAQQGRNLQRELADLQNEQFFQDLGLKKDLGFGDLNLRTELGRGDLDVRNRGLDIQRELGLGDLDVRRYGIDVNKELGLGDLDLKRLGLSQEDRQFYDRLGFDKSRFEAEMNANVINQLLGF